MKISTKLLVLLCVLPIGIGASWSVTNLASNLAFAQEEDEEGNPLFYDGPITIAASLRGQRGGANISVNSAGQVAVEYLSNEGDLKFDVEDEELDRFRDELKKQKFYELKSKYEQRFLHATRQHIAVTIECKTHSVTMFPNRAEDDPNQKDEDRFMAIWAVLEGWIDAQKNKAE